MPVAGAAARVRGSRIWCWHETGENQPMNSGLRILQLAHNHPSFHPGGTEIVALALHHEAMARGLDSWFLGALDTTQRQANPGTQMIALTDDHREAAIFFDDFRRFSLEQDDHYGALREFRFYLEKIRPDVIHVHHILNFGLEVFLVIRSVLPKVRIILTLHDYYLICANNGQLYKHETKQRCEGPSQIECMNCFPERSAADFVMRELDVNRALSLVDRVISPSAFLKDKFERGLRNCPPIDIVENGYVGAGPPLPVANPDRPLPRIPVFGYFGNISTVKGLGDLLEAAGILEAAGVTGFLLHVHGSQLYEDKAMDKKIKRASARLGNRLVFSGKYETNEIAEKMRRVDVVVFPSLWWENAPLVIYEALANQKLVISYPHGAAPEILARHSTGLLAERSDPAALADAMQRVIAEPSVATRHQVASVPRIANLLDAMLQIYQSA